MKDRMTLEERVKAFGGKGRVSRADDWSLSLQVVDLEALLAELDWAKQNPPSRQWGKDTCSTAAEEIGFCCGWDKALAFFESLLREPEKK